MRRLRSRFALSASAIRVLGYAAGILSTGSIDVDAQSAAKAPRADLTIVAGDFFLRAPRTVPAGRTTIRLHNLGPRFHHAALLRIAPGESRDAVIERIKHPSSNSDQIIRGTVSIGGPEGRMPSGDSFATVDLESGEYLIICTIPLDDGTPHAAKGMYAPLTVTRRRNGPPAQRDLAPDLVVRMTDYAYTLSTDRLQAGWRTMRVHNDGPAEHIAEIGILKTGRSAGEMLQWANGGFRDAQNPKTTLGGSTRLAVGRSDDIRIYLAPGRYVFFCMLHGPADRHHLKLGMLKELIVE